MIITLKNKLFSSSLYRNSIYIMLSTVFMSVFGFVFWTLCTKFFSQQEIGITTAIFSAATLLSSFSLIGQNNAIFKFLPSFQDKNKLINTAITVTSLLSLVVCTVYILGINVFSPELSSLKSNTILMVSFILYVLLLVISNIIDSTFIAYKKAEYVLIRTTFFSIIKLFLPFVLIVFNFYSIYFATLISVGLSVLLSIFYLYKKFSYKTQLEIDKQYVVKSANFSLGNYFASFFGIVPANALPLIIIGSLGASASAVFYMCIMVVGLIHIIPKAITQSVFAESSYEGFDLFKQLKKSFVFIYALITPLIITTVLLGQYVLQVFGKAYSEDGLKLLQLLAIAAFFISINYVGDTLLNIKHKIKAYIFMNVYNASIIVFLTYFFIGRGLEGVGYAWLIGQAICAFTYILIVFYLKNKKQL